jgi:hypothetical protein
MVINRYLNPLEIRVIRFIFIIAITSPQLVALNNESDVDQLHEQLPQPIHTLDVEEWSKWKTEMDTISVRVYEMLSESALNFLNNKSFHEPLLYDNIHTIGQDLNDLITVQSVLLAKKHEFKQKVIDYYALILKLVATHQTFTLDEVPAFEPLPNTDGSTLVEYFPRVYDMFKTTTEQLIKMHEQRPVWPVFELYYDCNTVVVSTEQYLGYSAVAVNTFFKFNPSKEKEALKYGKMMPTLYTKCMILLRYFQCTDQFEFSDVKFEKSKIKFNELVKLNNENDFWFVLEALVSIAFVTFLIGFNINRMYKRQ